MPNRLLWTALSAGQLFTRLQLPFLAAVVLVSGATAAAVPALRTSVPLGVGLAVAGVASVVFAVQRHRWMHSPWAITVPVLDIVAIGFVRAALYPYLPAVGMLCLLPFAWIAFRFPWQGLLLVFGGGIVVAGLPFVLGGDPLTSLLDVLNVVTLPLIATGISVGVHIAARSFRRGRERVEAATTRTQGALAASRDDQTVLRAVLDTVNAAVAFYDADGRLVLANAVAERFVGIAGIRLDAPRYAGENVFAADRSTPIPFEDQIVPRALRGEVVPSHLEWVGPPGDRIAVLASSRRVERASGELLGTVVVAHDVTDLADAIEVREEFLTTVSHELRTPLTSVIGYADEVTDILGDEAERLGVAAGLGAITRNGEILLERVSQLLTAGNKKLVLTPTVVDVGEIVDETVEAILPAARHAGISVTVTGEPDVIAELDARRIRQAVENLLSNAVKFTDRGGDISVQVRHGDADDVLVVVADDGIGMTADEKRRVFDRFYRSTTVRKNAVQGIGVGLSIVKSIVLAHDGSIDVESAPGVGTTISLSLPRMRERQQPADEFALSA